jgi:import inner membrane translocase subunit TIM23
MVYNGINSTIGHYRGRHDVTNSVMAGALSGAIFKSTRGVRPMAISSGIVASVAGSWAVCPLTLTGNGVGTDKIVAFPEGIL